MTNRGQFAQLLSAGLMVTGAEMLDEMPEEFSKFAKVETSDSAYEEEQFMAGLGLVRKKDEGDVITFDEPIQGGSIRAIHETYALGWEVTKEMLADDKYGKIREIPEQLMPSLRYVVEQVAANPLNLGFSSHKTVDGVSFFNTAHPLLGGGTVSNQLANNAPFSQTALQDMIILGENFVNDRGMKRPIKINMIHIAPELEWLAKKVLRSELEPGTGNNDINVTKNIVDYTVHHFFTSTTQWFGRNKQMNKLKFFWRQKPNIESTDDFNTKGTKHSIDARFQSQAMHYAGWFGSTGVGQ